MQSPLKYCFLSWCQLFKWSPLNGHHLKDVKLFMRKIQWVCQWSISINKTAWVYDTGCEGLWHCQQFSLSVWGFISLLSHMLQDLRSYHIVYMYKPVWEQLVMLKIGNYRYYISLFKDNTAFMTYIWKQFHVKEVDRESVDCLCF